MAAVTCEGQVEVFLAVMQPHQALLWAVGAVMAPGRHATRRGPQPVEEGFVYLSLGQQQCGACLPADGEAWLPAGWRGLWSIPASRWRGMAASRLEERQREQTTVMPYSGW